MKILLANPRGFCAGVNMAIECLEVAIELFGPPVYVYHEIVHNKHVVDEFRDKGAVFVDDLEDVPEGSHLMYSAHGVSPQIRSIAARRRLHAIDATCPLVTKVHTEAMRYATAGYTILLIGHEGHDEVVGTIGEAPEAIRLIQSVDDVDRLQVADPTKLAYLTQTTLSVDDASQIINRLRKRFPHIVGPRKDDICYATQNRQEAVQALVERVDVVLVLGSQNSSNSNRLAEIARAHGKTAYLIDDVSEVLDAWFHDVDTVLITAGASAPEMVVQRCVSYLCDRYDASVEHFSLREEHQQFFLPAELLNVSLDTTLDGIDVVSVATPASG